jgi:hypothetical protein
MAYVTPVLNVVATARNVIDHFDEVVSHSLCIYSSDKLVNSLITQSKPTTLITATSSFIR